MMAIEMKIRMGGFNNSISLVLALCMASNVPLKLQDMYVCTKYEVQV